jgi:hypothetical protein
LEEDYQKSIRTKVSLILLSGSEVEDFQFFNKSEAMDVRQVYQTEYWKRTIQGPLHH